MHMVLELINTHTILNCSSDVIARSQQSVSLARLTMLFHFRSSYQWLSRADSSIVYTTA